MDEPRESSERPDRVLVLVEQLIHMVAENNRLMADLRSEVRDLRSEVATLRSEVGDLRSEVRDLRSEVATLRAEVSEHGTRLDGVEQRLSAQLSDMATQQKQDRAVWQAESRHFAHAIGVLERDVAVLKER